MRPGQGPDALAVPAATAAHGLHAITDGLIQNWLLAPSAFDLVSVGQQVVKVYLGGLGFSALAPTVRPERAGQA